MNSITKAEATKAFNAGKPVTLKWDAKPEGVTITREQVAKFFGVPVTVVKFSDVCKNGYPHKSLTFHA